MSYLLVLLAGLVLGRWSARLSLPVRTVPRMSADWRQRQAQKKHDPDADGIDRDIHIAI